MGKTLAGAVLVALILWTAWRTHATSDDLARLERAASAPALAESPRPTPAPPPPALAASEPPSAAPWAVAGSDAARLAAIEERLKGLESRLGPLEETAEAMRSIAAELTAARLRANETAAIATARNAISAAAQIQASARCDVDQDGTGEYAGFLEMSGAVAGRMARVLVPPVLSSAFRELTSNGEATRSGYHYRIYLPGPRGEGVGEPSTGFEPSHVSADLAETTWCVYAWPVEYGVTGTRTFFTNQGGDVTATDARAYSGTRAGPAADAAFQESGTITGRVAFGRGADGNVWKQVN